MLSHSGQFVHLAGFGRTRGVGREVWRPTLGSSTLLGDSISQTIFYNGVDVSLELSALAGTAVPSTGESTTGRSDHW
jgi:hypothetical protein